MQHSKLLWRCRRGMREMDILLLSYLENHYYLSSEQEKIYFAELLDENDPDIYAWITESSKSDIKYCKIIQTIRKLIQQKHQFTSS